MRFSALQKRAAQLFAVDNVKVAAQPQCGLVACRDRELQINQLCGTHSFGKGTVYGGYDSLRGDE